MELDCSNSSDALLMNIFCYRRAVTNNALSAMLGIASGWIPEFGFRQESLCATAKRIAPKSI